MLGWKSDNGFATYLAVLHTETDFAESSTCLIVLCCGRLHIDVDREFNQCSSVKGRLWRSIDCKCQFEGSKMKNLKLACTASEVSLMYHHLELSLHSTL
jgi:hypothetical protein